MKVVVDTNVFVSAVFFGGVPLQVLDAWRRKSFEIVVTSEILDEYRRVSLGLLGARPYGAPMPWIALVEKGAITAFPAPVPPDACEDSKDLCFLAGALGGGAKIIVSGDKHLLKVSGFRGIRIMRPKAFVEEYIR